MVYILWWDEIFSDVIYGFYYAFKSLCFNSYSFHDEYDELIVFELYCELDHMENLLIFHMICSDKDDYEKSDVLFMMRVFEMICHIFLS